ncbi:MAG: type III pantothenate kinase [Sulfurimonas sp.]
MGSEELLLADIGNTHFHIYKGKKVERLAYEDAIERYQDKQLFYISVKHHLEARIAKIRPWRNISGLIRVEGEYGTMGVDRKALCLSHPNGIFVDAGSAITVDVMEEGVYQGGFILPGLNAYLKSYAEISEALITDLNRELDLSRLPLTTKDGISYGIIASIKALIDQHRDDQTLYFTGGDGAFLSRFFEDAIYDESLVFQGMMQALNTSEKLEIRN